MRLVKDDTSNHNVVSASEVLKRLEEQVTFVQDVLRPLLGNFVHCPNIVPLTAEEISVVNKRVQNSRPAQRCNKSVKEVDTYVLILPDYCSLPPEMSVHPTAGPVISIEIKPKQGFMLKEECLPPSQFMKSQMCRFCMMQYYKLKTHAITRRSGYCPMDLFSGCPGRMYHAFQELLKTPQNNFRIFKNQELVYSEEKREDLNVLLKGFFTLSSDKNHADRLCHLVIKALLKPFNYTSVLAPSELSRRSMCSNSAVGCAKNCAVTCHGLPKGSILDRVLKVQMLDTLDITEIYSLFLELREFSQNQSKDVVGIYSRCQIPLYLGEKSRMPNETELEFASRKVWEFLVALTLKDCSLMLVFKRLNSSCSAAPSHVTITDDMGQPYLFSLAITDLDSKPLSKVEKVLQDSHAMIESYLSATSSNIGSTVIC